MTDPPTGTTGAVGDDLFDKYTLPKIALAAILAASFVGTWVTARLHGGIPPTLIALKWAYFVALGVLTGGLVWKHVFVRPADLGTDASTYCAEMYARFDRIVTGSLVALVAGAAVVLSQYAGAAVSDGLTVAVGVTLGLVVVLAAGTLRRSAPVEEQFRSGSGLVLLSLTLTLVVLTAAAEVTLQGFTPVAAGVRVLHLLAFALWIGGAVWNIFVAVPTGQEHTTTAVVRAAGEQLERFRWAVRLIIPTLLVTGLYQAVDALGWSFSTYVGSTVGLAVLAKVGFIGSLFVIFKLCPMWRACSPIDGVCELDDLGADGAGGETAASMEGTGDD